MLNVTVMTESPFFVFDAGAMGVRTAHQVDPKAQLVVSTSYSAQDSGYTSGEDSAALDSMSLGAQAESSELKGLTTDSDVLSAPKMEGSGGAAERPLGGLEQAVLLGWAQQIKKGTSADELQVRVAHSGLGYSIHVSINDSVVLMNVNIWRILFPRHDNHSRFVQPVLFG